MATEAEDTWAFSRRFHGYDVQEVDDYLGRLTQYAHLLENRAVAAEHASEAQAVELTALRERLAQEGGAQVAGRLAEILALAQDEADEILAKAQTEAGEITTGASADAERMRASTVEERRLIEQQLAEMSATRAALLEDLRSLSAQIAETADQYHARIEHPDPEAAAPTVFDAEASAASEPIEAIEADEPTGPTPDPEAATIAD
jgi:cell division septum initiation protein DivIVA